MSHNASIAKELKDGDIIKPLSDKRTYCHITLANKLEALLISDPDADKCAAAMDVHVGQFHDTVFGLAHFLGTLIFIKRLAIRTYKKLFIIY